MIAQIHPQELQAKIEAGETVYLLDVRQPNEHEYASIEPCVLIPLGELAGRMEEVEPPEGAMVVVYCHHGVRSLSGAAILQQAGFKNVASLSGGIEAWSVLVDPKVRRY
jgi:rhodanese-related sulfurtransferase